MDLNVFGATDQGIVRVTAFLSPAWISGRTKTVLHSNSRLDSHIYPVTSLLFVRLDMYNKRTSCRARNFQNMNIYFPTLNPHCSSDGSHRRVHRIPMKIVLLIVVHSLKYKITVKCLHSWFSKIQTDPAQCLPSDF